MEAVCLISLTDTIELINHQVVSQEKLTECLSKAEAMIRVALGDGFLNYEDFIINDYLWALSNFIEQARTLSEHLLNSMLKRA